MDKFKAMKPVQRLPIVVFAYVFLYYWLIKGNIDWEKILGYTMWYWIFVVLVMFSSGYNAFQDKKQN